MWWQGNLWARIMRREEDYTELSSPGYTLYYVDEVAMRPAIPHAASMQ